MAVVVLKCGGSLLRTPAGVPVIRRAVDELLRGESVLIVVGGGEVADLVRRWSQWWQLSEEAAHWLAVEAMRFNTQILAAAAAPATWPLATALEEVASGEHAVMLADPVALLRESEECLGIRLPTSWDVTSDSIALLIAAACGARRLVLLKRRVAGSIAEAAREGIVDGYFRWLQERFPSVEVLMQQVDSC